MRHLKKGKKFSRKRDQRRALLKNLAAQVILKEKIITTPDPGQRSAESG